MSAGAGITFALAWTIGDRLAAIGAVANGLGKEGMDQPLRLTRPLPVVHFMGTEDRSVPYQGGKALGIWDVHSAEETVAFWAKHNRAQVTPITKELPEINSRDNSRVVTLLHRGGPAGADVLHYRIVGGGHTWPNGPEDALGRALFGETNRDIDAGEELWRFFQSKSRVAPPAKN